MLHHALLNWFGRLPQGVNNVVYQVILIPFAERTVTLAGLLIVVGQIDLLSHDVPFETVLLDWGSRRFMWHPVCQRVWLVIDRAATVGRGLHDPIALVVANRRDRSIDGDLKVVRAQPVTLSVPVGKGSTLQELVGGEFDAGDDGCRTESGLFYFGKVVFWIAIQYHLADQHEREFVLGPGLGWIQVIETLFRLVGDPHDLHIQGTLNGLASGNRAVQVANGNVRVNASQASGFVAVNGLDSRRRLPVILDVDSFPFRVHPIVGVDAKPFHRMIALDRASVGEEPGDHVGRFRSQRDEIPKTAVG